MRVILVLVTSLLILKTEFLKAQQFPTWLSVYEEGGGAHDFAHKMAVDPKGNVYVLGRSRGANTLIDMTLIKYGPKGFELWVDRINGTGNGNDYGGAMTLDDSSNIYVIAFVNNAIPDGTVLAIKYDPSGTKKWTRQLSHSSTISKTYGTRKVRILVDKQGNYYIAGYTSHFLVLAKYSPSGSLDWEKIYPGPLYTLSNPDLKIIFSPEEDIFLLGSMEGLENGDNDMLTAKIDPHGQSIWEAIYDSGGNWSIDDPKDLVINSQGFIVGGGTLQNPLVKYDKYGNRIWSGFLSGSQGSLYRGYEMVMDENDNLYITGMSSSRRICTVKAARATTLSIEGEGMKKTNFTIFPNPMSYEATVSFSDVINQGNKQIDIYLYDQKGICHSKFTDVKTNQFEITRGNIPSGLYLLELRINEKVQVIKKLLII